MDRRLLARYLRQRAELGEREVVLDALTARGALDLLTRAAPPAPAGMSAEGVFAPVMREPAPQGVLDGLRELSEQAAGCTLCRLCEGRSTVVFGEGSATAEVMVVGEAPGFEEDRTGRPFVGPAGKLLDLLLLSAGFPRARVFICNVLKCRPPNNRNPLPDEVERCAPYLERQIELVAPRVLVAAGKFAAQSLLGSDEPIGKLRNRFHTYHGVPLIATYHPAFLLRSPTQVLSAWQDFQLIRQVLDEPA